MYSYKVYRDGFIPTTFDEDRIKKSIKSFNLASESVYVLYKDGNLFQIEGEVTAPYKKSTIESSALAHIEALVAQDAMMLKEKSDLEQANERIELLEGCILDLADAMFGEEK